ncbi:DEAD/DEAH box helicase [Rhizobium sp. Leaf384]|uniref:DEAD/DEAH box helicase n=1 Tax=unclassified Rhizobium TaxID=2613769 RepID=UPI000715658A|nr:MULTISPECIES: DEAD/DEAH box helicase [unclassified Rhizobium]KQS78957.1 DEAD/DEAH box helicase [Rhizobium sp. Leaf384]KQS82594.1 DEAD/DEAH box helicase [Rhizobium sp. Leaf383]
MSKTIQETIDSLHQSLKDYIEATYHISNVQLIAQRRNLLDKVGVTHQVPYLESTPRYQTGKRFEDIEDLPKAALAVYTALSSKKGILPILLHNPAYTHQADAIRHALVEKKNLLIMTGTGSGKTESFLMPILGKLAQEASERPESFKNRRAMRALLLYPMNALVNDQLGRMRAIFGDSRLTDLFRSMAGRPATFARYTSRTPYAGMRSRKKDPGKLGSFEQFFVEIERQAADPDAENYEQARILKGQLKQRGKWPAKPDLAAWFGEKGDDWIDRKTREFLRAVTLADDAELITRHEVQENCPDLLVTNYSMLEYMLMRPIERSIFDDTKAWLAENPDEKLTVVLDEAHLYRGAAGAEVGLLLRRLRDRLGISPERFQVIAATASFSDETRADEFGAALAGVPKELFAVVTGQHKKKPNEQVATPAECEVLASLDLVSFYDADPAKRAAAIKPFLTSRGIEPTGVVEKDLFDALDEFPPIALLINNTMKAAQPLAALGPRLFPGQHDADRALTSLLALGSVARETPDAAGLLPCRVHNFYRGLPGLWVCMDAACPEVDEADRSGICGKMYGQPNEQCGCGARVLQFYTCRNCGAAHARAHTDDVDNPKSLWSEPGQNLKMQGGEARELLDLDLLLEEPRHHGMAEVADYDLLTGQLNPDILGSKTRSVYIRKDRTTPATDDDGHVDTRFEVRGQFTPCAVCGEGASFGRTSVQDHQTKGDQPFQALVSRQIQVQPPGVMEPTGFAPLRGRKVLVFSDSRQVAARLAPNLQMYSTRDALRSLIVWGFGRLHEAAVLRQNLSLEDLYLAVMLASRALGVRLRPEMGNGETFAENEVDDAIADGAFGDDMRLAQLRMDFAYQAPPLSLLDDIVKTVRDKHLGLEALALASVRETVQKQKDILALPVIPGFAETGEEKIALARAWLRCWQREGFWLSKMPMSWYNRRSRGTSIRSRKSPFEAMKRLINDKNAAKIWTKDWEPRLRQAFTEDIDNGFRRLLGRTIALELEGDWVRCEACRSVHRPVPRIPRCLDCGSSEIKALDPETDPVFVARKGYYRAPVATVLRDPTDPPMAIIAAEHTAQLNAPQSEDVFSKAEENELLFQDVELTWIDRPKKVTAIDVLSSTTTMEVGIDIGALSGVALRNMPPGRANYQQRAGRAGRRGNAVATVVAFGSADSHDEHYFTEPSAMIAGPVVDPKLTLNNTDIVKRHIRAFIIQSYLQDRIPTVDPTANPDLFSVLGSVQAFQSGAGTLNRLDFGNWLAGNIVALRLRAESWIPAELDTSSRERLLSQMDVDCLSAIDDAVSYSPEAGQETTVGDDEVDEVPEVASEEGEETSPQMRPDGKLLDRLLYKGVLPRYAFPTDVATFNVFDRERSKSYRPIMKFAPSQGLPVALSQYAPGKQVWISGKCYTSGAVYSPMAQDRFDAWSNRRLYLECSECSFAETRPLDSGLKPGVKLDCEACGCDETFGPAHFWLRPPGFAHPYDSDEVTSPDDMPETAYATRAKLTMAFAGHDERWQKVNDRVRVMPDRTHLLVSNTGPKSQGYDYCTLCGRIESHLEATGLLRAPHLKPFPDEKDQTCAGAGTSTGLVLGTDFITDIALFSLRVVAPLKLKPARFETDVALRTVSEALAKAACNMLEIETGELMAEYRPALTPGGRSGLEAEIFLYDTLPGGAGFAAQIAGRSVELFERALSLMRGCPEGCDASCYRCLRSFKNKFEHRYLDRHVGIELLEYLVQGVCKPFDTTRVRNSTKVLADDLARHCPEYDVDLFEIIEVPGHGQVEIPVLVSDKNGRRWAVALSGPLTERRAADPLIAQMQVDPDAMAVEVVNELLVRGNIADATRRLRAQLEGAQ